MNVLHNEWINTSIHKTSKKIKHVIEGNEKISNILYLLSLSVVDTDFDLI
jgi:hypothetical protein